VYNKAIMAAIGAAVTWALTAYADNAEVSHWLGLVAAVLTAVGVFGVANTRRPG
jgi:hypothetical protein